MAIKATRLEEGQDVTSEVDTASGSLIPPNF